MASRLKRHLNKHCIRFDNILKAKARKREAAETRGKRTKPGDETEMTELEEPVRIQPDTITSEAHLDARWDYIRGLARAGVEGLQDKPNAAETDAAQTYDRLRIPLDITLNYYARAKRVTASLPRDLALAIMEKIQEARGTMWTERVRGPKAGIDTQQNMMERAQVWVWHEEPGRRQPAAPPQPPPATKLMQEHSQRWWHMGNREQRKHDDRPTLPAEAMCRQPLLYESPCLCHGGS